MSELGLKSFNANSRSNTTACTCTARFNSRAHDTTGANSCTKPHIKLAKKSACGHCAFFSLGSLTAPSQACWDSGVDPQSHFCLLSQDTVFISFMSLHHEGR